MPGDGPFLWFREGTPDGAFHHVPRGGFCINVFVFLRRGPLLLLGKYAPHPAWPGLTGLDAGRVARYGRGWTVPGSHMKLGEAPHAAARRVVTEMLGLPELPLAGPRVATEYATHPDLAALPPHFDLSFDFDGEVPAPMPLPAPPWFATLSFEDPRRLAPSDYAREHQDVVARWPSLP